jgi:hypothetical protein
VRELAAPVSEDVVKERGEKGKKKKKTRKKEVNEKKRRRTP